MADDTSGANVVAFPSGKLISAEADDSRRTHAREVALACLDEKSRNSEKALLALAHSIKRQRAFARKTQGMVDSITGRASEPLAPCFGDAVLYKDCELQIVKRTMPSASA